MTSGLLGAQADFDFAGVTTKLETAAIAATITAPKVVAAVVIVVAIAAGATTL